MVHLSYADSLFFSRLVSGMRHALRRKLWLKLGLILIVSALVIPFAGLCFSEQLLRVDHGKLQGEAMVVLGGDSIHRPPRALELYLEGTAPKVIISGTGDCGEVRTLLVGKGVPEAAIQLECKSRTTRENALNSISLLHALGARRVVIVTSWFHSRRALNCFRHYAPEIEFVSRPTLEDLPKSRWPNKYERSWVLAEYVKLLGYWVRFGICPF